MGMKSYYCRDRGYEAKYIIVIIHVVQWGVYGRYVRPKVNVYTVAVLY